MKIILKYIRILIYSILLLILTTLGILYLTVLNKGFIKKQFTEEHYKTVEKNIKDEMKRSMISSGINDSVIDDIFNYKTVEKSIDETLNVIYENHTYEIDTKEMQERLESNIQKYLENHNYKLEDEKSYHEFTKSIIDIYTKEFAMLDQVQKVGKYVQPATKIIVVPIAVLSLLLLLVLILRWKIYKRIISSCLFTNSILLLFGTKYIYNKAGLSSTYLFSETFSKILRKIINNTISYFTIISIIYIVLGLLIILLFVRERHKHHKKVIEYEPEIL